MKQKQRPQKEMKQKSIETIKNLLSKSIKSEQDIKTFKAALSGVGGRRFYKIC